MTLEPNNETTPAPAKRFGTASSDINVLRQTNLDFSAALKWIKGGVSVRRTGWNGKGMFIFLVPGSTFKVNRTPLLHIFGEGTEVQYHGHIDMKTAQGYIVPWLASQTDVLADDWEVVP